jgi:hypothetical protein
MTIEALELSPIQQRDWRLRVSMALTVGWLVLGLFYISSIIGWTAFATQQAPALGSFLEGAFAPLAFLWLVVGFFLQQQQLQENTHSIRQQLEEMRRAADLAEIQARAIAANETHARQDTFLRMNELVSAQLGMIAGLLVTSYNFGSDNEDITDLWRRQSRGESAAFSLEIIRICLPRTVEPREYLYGTEIRAGHTARFIRAFERLLAAAQGCDSDGLIDDALREGPHGRVYRLATENRPASQTA